jgi:hypothetical protein
VGDFNILLFNRQNIQTKKINTNILELNNTVDEMDLTDIYRVFHFMSADYRLFSAAHGTFSKIDQILCHKANLIKYKKIEIIPCIRTS